ncbi:MAG TPA: hypothetical protein ENK14_12175 [Caldithrix sp.]|nr:hypothetical protein [Caldithrix sp.]
MKRFFQYGMSLVFFSFFFLPTCRDAGYVKSTQPTEIVKVYFSDSRYNFIMEETVDIHKNKINCKLVGSLGPGIRVEAEDSLGNSLELDFPDHQVEGSGNLDGRVIYYNAAEKRKYAAGTINDVLTIWRGNLEMCEFAYTGPRLELKTTQGHKVLLDSLQILSMRRDD